MNGKKTRASLFALATAYLLYLCYGLFQGGKDPSSTMPFWMRVASIGVFAVSAAALAVYAIRQWMQGQAEEKASRQAEGTWQQDEKN